MRHTREKHSRRKESGAVLVLAVVMVVILALIGMGMIRLAMNTRVLAARTVTDIAARHAADAGLTEAVRLMNKKLADEPVWDSGSLPGATDKPLPNCNASFSYTVEGSKTSGFSVSSTGKCGFATRTVHTRLSIESLWFGVGVKEDVDIMSKTTFATIPEGSDLTIRTNSTADNAIKLYPNTEIPGDVICGPGGDPDTVISTKSSSHIDGYTYASEDEIQFPDVVVPELPYIGTLPAPDPCDPNLIELTDADSGVYDAIILAQGKKLHITHGHVVIYVTGEVRLHNAAELRLLDVNDGNVPASLDLYLGGEMQADQGSFLVTENHLTTGTRLKIYGTNDCTSIILMNSGELSAAIYAPYADMELKNSGAAYGSFTGNSLELKNSGEFYYDTRLLDIDINEDTAYLVSRWWEE
ncbi:MAG: DUF7305 domain-containing protein [Planctomycetota bacterium]|jgi:Tfp pilus assembly protein PilX